MVDGRREGRKGRAPRVTGSAICGGPLNCQGFAPDRPAKARGRRPLHPLKKFVSLHVQM